MYYDVNCNVAAAGTLAKKTNCCCGHFLRWIINEGSSSQCNSKGYWMTQGGVINPTTPLNEAVST